MSFELDNEKAIDVLIWWVEGSDGSIDYAEEQAVKDILEDIDYSLETFYQETIQHIGALGNEELKELVEKAIGWGAENFDHHRKQVTLALLQVIAESDGKVTSGQQEKLDKIQERFGIEDLEDHDS